ncbi:hypothetical protein J7L13_00850 [bacterium]|nr:hypothetical protein [bacterium]
MPCACKFRDDDDERQPVEVKHGYLVIYPDLMILGRTYYVKWGDLGLFVAKTDLGVISILKVNGGESLNEA